MTQNWSVIAASGRNRTCKTRERGRRNRLIGLTSMLNYDGMTACGFLGIFMTQKVLGLLPEVSRDPTKPARMIAEQENDFWKDCEKCYSSIQLLKDIF